MIAFAIPERKIEKSKSDLVKFQKEFPKKKRKNSLQFLKKYQIGLLKESQQEALVESQEKM